MGPFCDTCSDFYMEKTENISFFHLHGYISLSMQWLKMSLNGLQMEVLHIFIM